MIENMYCPHCDIRYDIRIGMVASREDIIKAQICYRCGGPAGQYPGDLMNTTEELSEYENFFEEPENIQILSINEQITRILNARSINPSEKNTLNYLLEILEEDRQILELAQTEDIPIFEINTKRMQNPFFEEF